MQKRTPYVMAFIVLLLIEVIIALFIHDRFIRPYIGDVLVVIVLYCFARIFTLKIKLLPIYIFIFAVAVECLQFLNIVGCLGLGGNTLANVVIGTSFDWKDIICYAVGCIFIVVIDNIERIKNYIMI